MSWEKVPFTRENLKRAGITPGDIKRLEDIRRVPFTTKQELLKSQEEHPIFGDFPCIPAEAATQGFSDLGDYRYPFKSPL